MRMKTVLSTFIAVSAFALIVGNNYMSGKVTEDVKPLFEEFNGVTTKTHSKEEVRDAEMRRLVSLAEEKARRYGLYSCSVIMKAHNPGTMYRKDVLRVDCSPFTKPKYSLPVVAEYVHARAKSSQ
jgi:hypothetical protein